MGLLIEAALDSIVLTLIEVGFGVVVEIGVCFVLGPDTILGLALNFGVLLSPISVKGFLVSVFTKLPSELFLFV